MNPTIDYILQRLKANKGELHAKKESVYKKTIAHTRGSKDFLADNVLKNYRTNEVVDRRIGRGNIIEPITRPYFRKATNKLINLLFNPETFKINAEKEVLELIDNVAKEFNSNQQVNTFLELCQKEYLEFVRDDANGYVVIRPLQAPENDNERVQLIIEFVYTKEIVDIGRNYLIYRKGNFLYNINNKTFDRYVLEKDKGIENAIKDANYSYVHNLNRLPYIVNGGLLIKDEDLDTYYESFLGDSLGIANNAIKLLYDKESLRIMHARPITIVKEIPCTNKNCYNGIDSETDKTCTVCSGSGKLINFNLGATITKRANESVDDEKDNSPFMEFYSPPLESLNYHKDELRETLINLEKSLEINTIDESQSGVAKIVEEQIRQISAVEVAKRIYSNISYLLQVMADLLFLPIVDKKVVTITYPNQFTLTTETGLIENIRKFKESGVSGTATLAAEKEFTNFKFATNAIEKRKCEIVIWYDKLACYTDEQVNLYINNFDKKDVFIHLYLPYYLENLAKEPNFLQKTDEQIKTDLDNIFSQLNLENNGTTADATTNAPITGNSQ